MAKRAWYEVRVRELVAPQNWQKKSKFYFVKSPQDAQRKYRGSGFIMWVRKASYHKALGVGAFFDLGDRLLKEFAQERQEGGDSVQKALEKQLDINEIAKNK